jgi:polysaccharide biosynthesis transport protein
MSAPNNSQPKGGHPAPPGMGVDDVLFTLFRHKWIILGFTLLGIVGAVVVRIVKPPLYVSKAKLMVHYVVESRATVDPRDPDSANVHQVNPGAENIINSEIEILTSLDIATQVVANVGSQKILARKGGGQDPLVAAGVIGQGIEVVPPRSSIITVSFKHPDKDIVQPVLDAIIHSYMHKHWELHTGAGVLDEYWLKEKDELARKLTQTEEDLKKAKAKANVLFVEDSKHTYQKRIEKVQDDLDTATRELAERQAVLGREATQTLSQETNNPVMIPADTLSEYSDLSTELEKLKKQERQLFAMGYKDAHPLVSTVRGQLRNLSEQKSGLEKNFPALKQVPLAGVTSGTNAVGNDLNSQLAEIKRLTKRVEVLTGNLSKLQAQATQVMDAEPRIAELERQRGELQRSYDSLVSRLSKLKEGSGTSGGNLINMSVVQNPTPPGPDLKKMLKLIGGVLAGCIAMGIGLAFLMDLVLDRSVKNPGDVERCLRMPVFLSIPDTSWNGRLRLPWGSSKEPASKEQTMAVTSWSGSENGNDLALAPWDPSHHLKSYAEGLRERVRTYFEVNDMNLKKPKLVAVTGCGKGTGVTTLASGLAAELSKTGDGNVLLVDMNGEQGTAHSFYMGKPGCGVTQVLAPDKREEAQIQDKLFVASIDKGTEAELAMVLPKRFSYLVPKLKASDYDYIVFDMPPVSPTSPTPRLASHMDLTLLILESEKTGQKAATRAKELMRESRANVATVLNKCRQHVPEALSQDL